MKRDRKVEVVEEVAGQIRESEAVFAVDYRGISVSQAAELRRRLGEAGARFRVVKNRLTLRAADEADAGDLKAVLEGPTALTFVRPDGDVALAAKALSQFRREHNVVVVKGGRMNGEPLTAEQVLEIASLPGREEMHARLVGVVAAPITGLVRGLNGLIAGLAIQLRQIADEGMVPRDGGEATGAAEAATDEPAAGEPAADVTATGEVAGDERAAAEGAAAEPDAEEKTEQAEAPAEGDRE